MRNESGVSEGVSEGSVMVSSSISVELMHGLEGSDGGVKQVSGSEVHAPKVHVSVLEAHVVDPVLAASTDLVGQVLTSDRGSDSRTDLLDGTVQGLTSQGTISDSLGLG